MKELIEALRGNSFNESHLSNTQVVDLETAIGLIEDFFETKAKEEEKDIVFHSGYRKLVDETYKKAFQDAGKQCYIRKEVNALEWIVERIESENENLDLEGDGKGIYKPLKSLYDKILGNSEEQPKNEQGDNTAKLKKWKENPITENPFKPKNEQNAEEFYGEFFAQNDLTKFNVRELIVRFAEEYASSKIPSERDNNYCEWCDKYKPSKLPSDEELDNVAVEYAKEKYKNRDDVVDFQDAVEDFDAGAIWMKEKLKK